MSVFARFAPRLQEAIVARLGWSSLRPVQELAGEALLAGHNAVILAPTAGGKTEACMFPVLSGLVDEPPTGLAALYVAPIKALLNNQAERLGLYTEMVGLDRFVWHGDTPSHARKLFKRDPTSLLMTTPESLEVMLVSPTVDDARLFADLRCVVIDEVHAFAGSDRGAHLMSVIERLASRSSHDIQRVGLSATVGNPNAILNWLQGSSERPGAVVDPPKVPSPKRLRVQHARDEAQLADEASAMAKGRKTLLFCQARATTELYATSMRRLGTTVYVHHSAISHEKRQIAEEQFHRGSDACIVCTSTLELGIDVGDLDHALQAEAPATVSSFLQRMGRTGRRPGQAMRMSFLCLTPETVLQAAALIELAKKGWVERVPVLDRCWSVLIHQLLTMALAADGVSPEAAWRHISRVPDFRGICRAEFERLIQWVLEDHALDLVSGRLILGSKAERRFGRRNFMDLYAVFSSPTAYAVIDNAGRELGTLQQSFVDRLAEDVSCFLLGGRPWVAIRIDHGDRQVQVLPAPRGRKPQWGGYLPQFLGFDVCQQMRALLLDTAEPRYLAPEALATLREQRLLFGVLERGNRAIEYDAGEIRWWTFAGGKINKTLAYALKACGPDWKIVTDNRVVTVRGDVARSHFDEAVERLREVELWEDEQLWREIAADLPNYRLSKFQSLMPAWIVRETVADYLLDVDGACRWLSGAAVAPKAVDLEAVAPRETIREPQPAHSPQPTLPVRWIDNQPDLEAACAELGQSRVIGLDVETSIRTQALCLVQMANEDFIAVIDALSISDYGPLARVMADESVVKVIHNESFERRVLGRYGIELKNTFDTLKESRAQRLGQKPHTLLAVCARELDVHLDKGAQMSNWARRPLLDSQLAYAALDAEVLVPLHRIFAPGRLV